MFVFAAKAAPAKAAAAAKAASSSSEDSSDSEEEKAPAKAPAKVGGNIHTKDSSPSKSLLQGYVYVFMLLLK